MKNGVYTRADRFVSRNCQLRIIAAAIKTNCHHTGLDPASGSVYYGFRPARE